MRSLSIIALLAALTAQADPPAWTRGQTLRRSGNYLGVLCEGTGPSRDLAHRSAMDQCRRLAANQVNDSFRVQALSVETEKMVAFHQEVSSDRHVTGLACRPGREYSEESADGSRRMFLECDFDLSSARVAAVDEHEGASTENDDGPTRIEQKSKLQAIHTKPDLGSQPKEIRSTSWHLILTTIPRCSEVLVRGAAPRIVPCDENPKTLLIQPQDRELLIRAQGRLPKHVKLRPTIDRAPSTETLEVHLEEP